MRPNSIKRLREILLNQTGQMSIFVALIFQVLFVFFAMVINIGLLVHDKINLQNAVDLAAFYGAQRQAEVLNEIAHINYQIRQDYKLLAWRYRVLGTLARQGNGNREERFMPPATKSNVGSLQERAWVNPAGYPEPELPSVCVTNPYWFEAIAGSDSKETYCFGRYNETIPKMPDVRVIAPFVPGISFTNSYNQQAQQKAATSCNAAGPLNWLMTMRMLFGYKVAIASRKQQIWAHRRNLISENFLDRNMEPVRDGVRKTLLKNLTKANADSFGAEGNFEFINGLSHPSCAREEGAFVLPEVMTAPMLMYVLIKNVPGGCFFASRAHSLTDELNPQSLEEMDPGGVMRNFVNEPEPTQPTHSSLGFEKNPWCMAYVGVKAQTRPHKPFAPFGNPVTLEARSFAQPFGGRVGPWYRNRWSRGDATSNGGERTDPLTSPRVLPGGGLDDSSPVARLPNYSRFPGDTLGMKSEIALGAQNHIFNFYYNKPVSERMRTKWFFGFEDSPETFDFLAGSKDGGNQENDTGAGRLRQAEISAVAPDLFDATYFSIDPSYYKNYVENLPNRYPGIPPLLGRQIKAGPDLGGRNGEIQNFDVEDQINVAFQKGFAPQISGKLFYPIRQWEHLLTSWAPNQIQNFAFPEERFGQCQAPATESTMIPGKCAAGGRVGYSVRVISKSHLLFGKWKIGGDGEAEGGILNPPNDDF